ncbi:protein of unknown function [Acidithiobacillus ferrivorans]|uniref:Uncharacterized protein n=1 Tax=Acidithiobacillus ferrivorans TaxID=160808 RepID=A0A060UKI7_9PROT|nr:hypothetical protein [Acidithiobacillus ferrivorans]CDQ09197.1 hypothetical protein AFERRI_240031 [Acidithiobacillus ferrivorans]SMH64866.1 protein of unknown function [Acidithiobacillus ferrivorans]
MNISTLSETALATTVALEDIRSQTQKAINRAYAIVFFVTVHGFFDANPAVNQINVQIDAEGGIGDEGQAYTSFSLAEIKVEVEPGVKQHYAYGFNDVEYHESGQIKLVAMDAFDGPLANEDLISAIKDRLQDNDSNQEWLTDDLPYAVGNPEGRGVTLTVDRTQVNDVADVLLHRLTDDSGRSVKPSPQQIQDAQDEIIDWLDYH